MHPNSNKSASLSLSSFHPHLGLHLAHFLVIASMLATSLRLRSQHVIVLLKLFLSFLVFVFVFFLFFKVSFHLFLFANMSDLNLYNIVLSSSFNSI